MATKSINRRNLLKTIAGSAAAVSLAPSGGGAKTASTDSGTVPKRIVFFLMHHGLAEKFYLPQGESEHGTRLAELEMNRSLAPLEPWLDRVNIVHGLHGKHVGPAHSGMFGALGGYRRCGANPPQATIDSVLADRLPESLLGQLCIGLDSLSNMRNRPLYRSLTALGPGKEEPMICDPTMLYKTLFGAASPETRGEFTEVTKTLEFIEERASLDFGKLSSSEQARHAPLIAGYQKLNRMRKDLSSISADLEALVPAYDQKYSSPEQEIQWHRAMIEITSASLRAGLTNVATIACGCGSVNGGSYEGYIGSPAGGHAFGHGSKKNGAFGVVHSTHLGSLVKLMQELEATPEGAGTMMDNTLIVYGSDNANWQHSDGNNWPFITIGNFGGTIKTGQFFDFGDAKTSINSFYNTLLHATGDKRDRFNMSDSTAETHDPRKGPIEDLLV